jgi:nucleoside-diphosphate-sugar epimerase
VANQRILVTGGAGLIGRSTVALLEQQGNEVVVFDAPNDVRDFETVLSAMDGCDAVIHLAGVAGPELAHPALGYSVNAGGTFAVFVAAEQLGIEKVVYASSINASGLPLGTGAVLPSRFPYDEDEPDAIRDWYSLSKTANEDAARMMHSRNGMSLTGIRYPLVRDVTASTFPEHLRAVMRATPKRAAAEGWSYLDVTDAAAATVAALAVTTPPAPGVLVAAPSTFLAIDTSEAAARDAPGVPCDVPGRGVGLDLTRSRDWLGFEATVLLDDVAPAAIISREEWNA